MRALCEGSLMRCRPAAASVDGCTGSDIYSGANFSFAVREQAFHRQDYAPALLCPPRCYGELWWIRRYGMDVWQPVSLHSMCLQRP